MTGDDPNDELEEMFNEHLREIADELTAFYNELRGESPRATAILAVAQIENEITKIIRRYFPAHLDKKVWDRIFGPGKPMIDLKNKTNLLEAFGAFGPKTRVTIEKLASIRNKFAHHPQIRTFKHPDVLRHCEFLQNNPVFPYTLLETATENDVRWLFITTAMCLHQRLEMISPLISGLGDPKGALP